MWVCSCNAFNEKAVQDYLDTRKDESVRLSEVYTACSEGKEPQCGTCTRTVLKDMITEHNKRFEIR